jgi:hypothetical protein
LRRDRFVGEQAHVDEPVFNLNLPVIKPMSLTTGALIFGGVLVTGGLLFSAAIGSQVIMGTLMLGGLIALVEQNAHLKWLITKSNRFIDIVIFTGSIYATVTLGVTIAGALCVMGIGYTLVYAPYLRRNNIQNVPNG